MTRSATLTSEVRDGVIQPFRLNVPQSSLDDLKARLAQTRWPDEPPIEPWSTGTSVGYMRQLVDYWRDRFDWRAQERAINAFAHFRAAVSGLGIHFIHQRGTGPAPLPLIITHGWPGSFIELLKIVPLLSDPARYGGDARDAFDVVIPSLPGYGFSDRPSERGMHPFRIADLWAELMAGLGYQRFGAQGGDWGASVATCLGFAHADMVAIAATGEVGPETTNRIMIGRTLVGSAAIRTVDKAMEVLGGTGLYRSVGLERLFRDVQGARYHPLQQKAQQRHAGRLALGLDIDE